MTLTKHILNLITCNALTLSSLVDTKNNPAQAKGLVQPTAQADKPKTVSAKQIREALRSPDEVKTQNGTIMPNWLQWLIVASLFGLSSFPVGAEELQCKYEQRFKGGGSKGANAKLEIIAGKIKKLVVYSFISSGQEGGGYICGIDTSEKHLKLGWSTNNKKTILEVSRDDSSLAKSVIEIEPIKNAYKINLEEASREACGFGAEWPEYIVIEKGNKKCRVSIEF